MIRHNLYEIDLDKQTAFCCACGYTKIHVPKSTTSERAPKVFCLKRWEELLQAAKQKLDKSRRLKPGWKPRHSLSEIDAEKMTAICTVCGPTDIQKNTRKGTISYICATKVRPYMRNYKRSKSPIPRVRPAAHRLSEIDEEKKTANCATCGPVEIYTWQGKKNFGCCCSNASFKNLTPAQKIRAEINATLVNNYKMGHGCKNCGYNKNPDKLQLYARSRFKKDPKIERLLRLPRERLIEELDKSDVLCEICRSLGHGVIKIDRIGNEIPTQFAHL